MYISRKLLLREQKYSTIEKECLAIKWALEELKYYLLGRRFTLVTDHAPLVWLSRNKDTNARVTRWFLSLQPFSFSVIHRSGTAHGNADALSRREALGGWSAPRSSELRGGGVWQPDHHSPWLDSRRAIFRLPKTTGSDLFCPPEGTQETGYLVTEAIIQNTEQVH